MQILKETGVTHARERKVTAQTPDTYEQLAQFLRDTRGYKVEISTAQPLAGASKGGRNGKASAICTEAWQMGFKLMADMRDMQHPSVREQTWPALFTTGPALGSPATC